MSLQITHVSCLDVKLLVYLFCSRHKGQEDPQAHCSHLCQRTQQAIRKINVKALRLRRVSDELSIRDARGRPPPPPWLHRGLRGGMVRISVPYARRDGDDRARARRSRTSRTRGLVADGLRRRESPTSEGRERKASPRGVVLHRWHGVAASGVGCSLRGRQHRKSMAGAAAPSLSSPQPSSHSGGVGFGVPETALRLAVQAWPRGVQPAQPPKNRGG